MSEFFLPNNELEVNFYNLIVDIRYGPETTTTTTTIGTIGTLESFDYNQIRLITKASIFGKKREIFRQIYDSKDEFFIESLEQNNESIEKVIIMFESLNCSSEKVKEEFFSNPLKLKLFKNHYAIKNVKQFNDELIIELKVIKNIKYLK